MTTNIKALILFIAVVCMNEFPASLLAQTAYKIIPSKDIAMKLSGTSTLHNWVMTAQTPAGSAKFIVTGTSLMSIGALDFSLPVEDLKSKETTMDNNAYKALKSGQYKNIVYTLTSANVSPLLDSKQAIKTMGRLSIAGVTKEISMDVYCQVNTDKTVACAGSKKMAMTEYQVKPPEFLLGVMKTGDEITLDFNLLFKK